MGEAEAQALEPCSASASFAPEAAEPGSSPAPVASKAPMTAQHWYWLALGALTLIVMIRGPRPMKRTALTLVANCILSLLFAWKMQWAASETYSLAMMAIDALSAIVVLIKPAGKAQSMIGLTFLLQITVYFSRLLTAEPNVDYFWWQLSVLAFLQLAILGGWWIHELGVRWRAVPWFGSLAHSSHRESME